MADLIAALVVAVFLVKQQRVGAAFRNTDAVIVAVYRGEVADEEKILFCVSSRRIKLKILRSPSLALIHWKPSYSSSGGRAPDICGRASKALSHNSGGRHGTALS